MGPCGSATPKRGRRALPGTVSLPGLDRFSDEYAPAEVLARLDRKADPEATGPHWRTVRGIICGGCCGWPEPPTSEEVHEAMWAQAGRPASGRWSPC